MKSKGRLFLIPTPLGDLPVNDWIPERNKLLIHQINHFIVEEIKTARRFLIRCGRKEELDVISLYVFNEHTQITEAYDLLQPCLQGFDMGIMSEAGIPCVADPGSALVKMAHLQGIEVIPLAGASSILMALMASGLNGQNFSFHGYLPHISKGLIGKLKQIESVARQLNQTQIFIETPYRNQSLFEILIKTLKSDTLLCIASEIGLPSQYIFTTEISNWRKFTPDIKGKPTVFLIGTNI